MRANHANEGPESAHRRTHHGYRRRSVAIAFLRPSTIADDRIAHTDFRGEAVMQSIRVVEEAKDWTRIRRTGTGYLVRELDIKKRGTFFEPDPRKLCRGSTALRRIGRIEVRIADLRQHIKAAHGSRARRGDARIGIGKKSQSGS